MSKPIETFTHTIRVSWADCDPADIVYTGRITYFAIESIDTWWEKQTGHSVYELESDHNTGSPFVHMSFDFISPITPRHKLVCAVELLKIGNSSIRFRVTGSQAGNICFKGEFVNVLVVPDSRKPQRPANWILEKIQHLEVTG